MVGAGSIVEWSTPDNPYVCRRAVRAQNHQNFLGRPGHGTRNLLGHSLSRQG